MVFFKFSSHFDFSSKDVISRAHVLLLEKVSREPGNEVSKSIHYFHVDHNAPCLPPTPSENFHNRCFQFSLGITVVSREIQDNGYAIFSFFFLGGGFKEGALWSMLKS